jgi:hypothetical protein
VFLVPVLAGAFLSWGCGHAPAGEAKAVKPVGESRREAVRPGEEIARYRPPADGRLTERQIEMYIEVERREREMRAADLATARFRAARELGYDPNEIAWVETRVREAERATASRTLEKRLTVGRERYLAALETERRQTGDGAKRTRLTEQIADFRRRAGRSALQIPPAVEGNALLLERYRDRLAGARP